MRLLFVCGAILHRDYMKLDKDKKFNWVGFQSVYNLYVEMIRATNVYGYFLIHVRTSDPTLVGNVEVQDVEGHNFSHVFEYVRTGIGCAGYRRGVTYLPSSNIIKMFHQEGGTRYVNAIFDSSQISAMLWKYCMSHNGYNIPVICRAEEGVDSKGNDWLTLKEPKMFSDLGITRFSRMFTLNVFFNAEHKKSFIQSSRRFLKPNQIRDLDKNTHVLPNWCDLDLVLKYKQETRNESVGYFGTLIDAHKNVKFLYRVFGLVWASGSVDSVKITTGMNKGEGDTPPSFIDTHYNRGKDYLEVASKCKVFVVGGIESFSVVVAECMSLGIVPVLPKMTWVSIFVSNDYPFLYEPNNEQDCALKIRQALESFEDWTERVSETGMSFDSKRVCGQYLDLIKSEMPVYSKEYRFEDELIKWCNSKGSFDLEELLKSCKHMFSNMKGQVVSNNEIITLLAKNGFVDRFDNENVLIEKA